MKRWQIFIWHKQIRIQASNHITMASGVKKSCGKDYECAAYISLKKFARTAFGLLNTKRQESKVHSLRSCRKVSHAALSSKVSHAAQFAVGAADRSVSALNGTTRQIKARARTLLSARLDVHAARRHASHR